MKELREKNPTAWNDERARRRWNLWWLIGVDIALVLFLWFAKYKYTLPGDFQRFGPLLWIIGHMGLCVWVGRQEPLMVPVMTSRMAGEELLRQVTDEMTLTQAARKDGATSLIVTPPHSLEHTKGYRFTIRVHQAGNPIHMLTGLPTLAHKLQKGNGQVFTYQGEDDNSLITGVVLKENPWKQPPTQNPLVMHLRPFNLWTELVHLGYLPDMSDWVRQIVSEGGGGGCLIGGAPRKGKGILIKNLLTYIGCHLGSNIHMIDCKDLDFVDLKPIAETYIGEDGMMDIDFLRKSSAFLEGMKQEIHRRKPLLQDLGADYVTEEICHKLNIKLEWIFIDELAAITEDLMSEHRTEVIHFISLLQYIVRMGPAFGVFCILATQRPSNKSVPDSIRSLIVWKIAFYISTQAGSMAIMGKAGPEYRADWLPHDEVLYKGVALSIGDGRVRTHNITKPEFKEVCRFIKALRAGETNKQNVTFDYPELIKNMITIMESENQTRMHTNDLIARLADKGMKFLSGTELASKVLPYGVSSGNVNVNGKQAKGYKLENLKSAPKIINSGVHPTVHLPSGAVPRTAPDGQPIYLSTSEGDIEDD
jgi:hypothetical protein